MAYLHSTASVGTAEGDKGFLDVLDAVDRLAHQLTNEHGKGLEITMLSDHGHTLCPARHAGLAETLETGGFRVRDRLEDAKDVAVARFGLVTYAAMWTPSAAAAAQVLLDNAAANLVAYRDEEAVRW